MKKAQVTVLIIFLVLVVAVFFLSSTKDYPHTVKLAGKQFKVKIAETPREMQKGLSHKNSLCQNCGMLFVFEEEKHPKFWMKDTTIPLDMVFINSDLEVVDIYHADPCKRKECKTYSPSKKSLYVLEVLQNTFSKKIIGERLKGLETIKNSF